MQRFHKTLGICILVTAVVYAVIKMVGGVGFDARGNGDAKARSRDAIVRDERGEKSSDASTRKLRMRARKLTSAEATEFLKLTIIPRIDFENITLEEALKIVNEEIAKQTPNDQPRPRILFHPSFKDRPKAAVGSDFINMHLRMIDELRDQKVPASNLLKYICDKTKTTYWFYRGDFYFDPTDCDWRANHYYSEEKLSRVKLENIDASQLASKVNEIIENHDHFGPKTDITILTTEKARAALLRGELQLPRINFEAENVTSREAMKMIAEHSNGEFVLDYMLLYNPLKENLVGDDPFSSARDSGIAAEFNVVLNEKILEPNPDILKGEIPPIE